MIKIINDTLKYNGKYSRKSLTTLVAFSSALIYEFILPFYGIQTKEYVFDGLLILTGATLGLTVVDKFKTKNTDSEEIV